MNRKAGLGFLVALVLVGLLVFYARPIAQKIVGLFYPSPAQLISPIHIAHLENIDGAVLVKSGSTSDFLIVKSNHELFHFDQIKTEKGSTVDLIFNSGWKLQLGNKTSVIIESYRPESADSPILMTLVYGTYSVSKSGIIGKLFVLSSNKIMTPKTLEINRERQIVIPPAMVVESPSGPLTPAASVKIEGADSPELPSAKTPGKMPEKLKSGEEETLSSQYIEGVLSAHANDFRKCQLNNVRDNDETDGSLLMSLTIQPTGKAQNVKILQNSSKNVQLGECAKSVLERTQFRTFTGLPITLTYPLEFK